MRYSISNTAEYGDLTRGPRIINKNVKKEMKKVLEEIQTGKFVRDWILECKSGQLNFKAEKKIQNENISLKLQLENLKKITGEENYKFKTIKSKVLLYKTNILHQTIIINKGSKDGIKIGDPLIKNNILVGKIIKTNWQTFPVGKKCKES